MDPREQLITQIKQSVTYIGEYSDIKPSVGIILGSGMSEAAGKFDKAVTMNYSDIPNFPEPTTAGHIGKLTIGLKNGISVAALQGRFHFYEGYTLWGVTLPVRVLAHLGCKFIINTNCAGGLQEDMDPGSFMAIKDHINLIPSNPLTGPEIKELGTRFISMIDAYDPALRFIATDAASALGIDMTEGVYAAVQGPSYETPAEIDYIKKIGADAVGMSTVPEVIVARQQDMKVLGLSVITNNALKEKHISHKEVLAQAGEVKAQLEQLLSKIIEEIGEKSDEL